MDNDEFKDLYHFLDALCEARSDGASSLRSLHPGGWVSFSRKVRADLEEWERQVIARAKAKYENASHEAAFVRREFGEEEYDAVKPDHHHGLDFGPSEKTK